MKCCAVLALLAVYVYSAPTGSLSGSLSAGPDGASSGLASSFGGASGSMSSSVNSAGGALNSNVNAPALPSGQPSGPDMVKGFQAVLYLFAPESWITAFNSVPQEGQICFVKTAGNPANQAVWNGEDVDAMKKNLQDNCPDQATQLNTFVDASAATYKSLPDSFVQLAKTWGESMKSLGEQVKQTAASNPGVKGKEAFNLYKPYFAQFATATGTFLQSTAKLSDTDRQQISTAFPKLTPFFSGDQSVNFLNQAGQIYQTLGSGNADANALKTQGQQLQATLKTVWQQYTTGNADGLQKAKELGVDLTNVSGYMNMQADAPMGGFASAHPELARLMSSASDEGKEKWNAMKTKFAEAKANANEWVQNAKQSEDWQKVKQNWQDFKENTKEQFAKAGNSVKEGADAIKNKLNGAPDSGSVNVSVQ